MSSVSPAAISFSQIPVSVRVPGQYIEYDNSQATQGLASESYRILIIGQKLASGSQPSNTPLLITPGGQATAAFGQGSMLARMCDALLAANGANETWAVALDDNPAGAAATGKVAIAGTATAAGTLPLYIGGDLVQVGVSVGDTAAIVATNLVAAIAEDIDLPVTAGVDGTMAGQVDLTARHKGLCGNDIDLRTWMYSGDAVPTGLTVTITPMAGGTANPIMTTMIASLGDVQYHAWAIPYTDGASLLALTTELSRRAGAMVQLEGRGFAAQNGALGTLTAAGQAQNSERISIMGVQGSPTPPCIWAAVMTGIAAASLSIDPARPLQTLGLPGILPPTQAYRFPFEDRDLLLHDGISTFTVGRDGTVSIERMITTYQVNKFGLPDISYLDVETVATLDYLRFSVRDRISTKFPRCTLADDGTKFDAGLAMVTPSIIKSELIALGVEWVGAGLIDDIDQYKALLTVARNASDRDRVDSLIPPNVVGQFRVFAGLIQFQL